MNIIILFYHLFPNKPQVFFANMWNFQGQMLKLIESIWWMENGRQLKTNRTKYPLDENRCLMDVQKIQNVVLICGNFFSWSFFTLHIVLSLLCFCFFTYIVVILSGCFEQFALYILQSLLSALVVYLSFNKII